MQKIYSSIILIIFIITSNPIFGEELAKRNIKTDSTNIKNAEILNESDSENYFSYSHTNISFGWQSQFKPLVINSRFIFSINYKISNFFNSLEERENQIGLSNEIGLNNLSIYLEVGPELRLLRNVYLIPELGIAYAWIAGIEKSGIGFLYYYGAKGGYVYSLNRSLFLQLETGIDFIPIEETQGVYFAKIGILLDLF